MHVAALLPPEAVVADLSASDKKQALKLLSSRASALIGLSEREIYSVLMEREQVGCTGMGGGVCVPHGRFTNLSKIHAMFVRLDKSVDFGAADGRPVDLLFLLFSPASANTDHIKALAVISRQLRDKILCEALRKAPDAATIHQLLTSERGENAA